VCSAQYGCFLELLLLLLLLLHTAFELSLSGSSPYVSTDKTNKNKYIESKQYKTVNTSTQITKTTTHDKTHIYTLPLTYLLTYLLTYSTVQSPSGEPNWFAASQEILRISRNPKVHYRTHNRPPPVCILGQPNPVHIPTSHLPEIYPNIIHPFTPRSPQWSLIYYTTIYTTIKPCIKRYNHIYKYTIIYTIIQPYIQR